MYMYVCVYVCIYIYTGLYATTAALKAAAVHEPHRSFFPTQSGTQFLLPLCTRHVCIQVFIMPVFM